MFLPVSAHRSNDLIERNTGLAYANSSPSSPRLSLHGSRDSISLCRNLYLSAQRIAGHPDDVPWHFPAASACSTDAPISSASPPPPLSTPRRFPLTANFRSQNRGVLFKQHRDMAAVRKKRVRAPGSSGVTNLSYQRRNDAARHHYWRREQFVRRWHFLSLYRNRAKY